MKKKIVVLLCIFLLFNIITVYAGSALYGYYHDFVKIKVQVDGQEVESDVPAFIADDTAVVPLNALIEKLDAIVFWNEEEQTAEILKPNVNILFTANPVFDKDNNTYVVYAPFGKINKSQRYHFSFHVFCEVDNLPQEEVEINVILKDPDGEIVKEGYSQIFDASEENSLQYINFFENIDFTMTGNYSVEVLLKSEITYNEFVKIGEKQILVKK